MRTIFPYISIGFFALLLCGSVAYADEFTSTSFTVLDPVMSPAGFGTSSGYQMWGSMTELAIGTSTATDFGVNSGFLFYPEVSIPVVGATAGDAQVVLSWTASEGFLGWTASSYSIGQSTSLGGPYSYTSVGNVFSSTRTGLTNNVPYYFVVIVKDIFGNPIGTSTEVAKTPTGSGSTNTGGGGGGGTSYIIDQILGTATFCSIGGNGLTGRADLNGDGKVNLVDLSILLFHLGKFNVEYDCNSDNKVDFIDISIMFYYWTE